jgi:hypothetical protein
MYKLLSVLSAIVLMTLIGCGGSGSGDSSNDTNNNNAGNVVIDSPQKAINAVVALGQVFNTTEGLDDDIDNANRVNSRSVVAIINIDQTSNCLLSGTMSISGTADETATPPQIDVTTSFNQCKNNSAVILDGSIHTKGSENDMTITFTNYAKITLHGTNKMNLAAHVQSQNGGNQVSVSLNGTISSPDSAITFTNYIATNDETTNLMTLDGTVTITHTPSTCADGQYVIETVQPLYEDPVSEQITSGQLKINNVLFTFQSDGTATATINGQTITIDTDQGTISCP